MGIINRVESGLARAVHRGFAKAFKSEVEPVEIASAIRRAMDDRAALLGPGRALVPNLYTIELSTTDYDRLESYEADLADDLVAAAQEHADSQGYAPGGPLEVTLTEGDSLETGVFRVRPATSKRSPQEAARAEAARQADSASAQQHQQRPQQRPQQHAGGRQGGRPRANPNARPWLDIDGDRYPLIGSLTVLGRDETADVIVDDAGVSRRHSEIRVTTDGPHLVTSIRDLGSTNGTFVNGERISSQRLADGDRITLGRTSATFRAGRR